MKSFREYLNEKKLSEADIMTRKISTDKIKDIISANKDNKLGDVIKGVDGAEVPGSIFVEYDNHGLVYTSKNKIILLSVDNKEEINIYVDTKKLKSVL